MPDPQDEHDARIAELLDAARAEMRNGGTDITGQVHEPGLAGEVDDLLEIVRDLDAAALDWQQGDESPQNPQDAPTVVCAVRPPGGLARDQRLGRYAIQDRLGAGGMGTVYRAFDPLLNRHVAIKVPEFESTSASAGELRQRFLREARAAAVVRHPNVCPVYDVGQQNLGGAEDVPYVVMALIEGRDLGDVVAAGPLEPSRALKLFHKIAAGLEAVHARKLIHRDLKPRNIILDAQEEPHLTDFGLSRFEGDTHLTAEGIVVGTPLYMAPEQLAGQKESIGPRSDIYALGVLLYQMLTGRLPFEGAPLVLMQKIMHGAAPAPSTVRPGLDPALDGVVARAMASDPGQRYDSVGQFAKAVMQVDDTKSLPGMRMAREDHKLRPRRRWLTAASAMLFFGVVGLVVYPLIQGHEKEEARKDGPGIGLDQNSGAKARAPADPQPNREPQIADADHERRVAAWVLSAGGKIEIDAGNKPQTIVIPPLPAGPFRITKVDLRDCLRIADADLAQLAGCRCQELDLTRTRVTDAGLLPLSHLPDLRRLTLMNTNVTGTGLKHLYDLRALQWLLLTQCPIDDAALARVAGLADLERLNLDSTRVTNSGLKHLTGLKNLRNLQLGDTAVTDAGMDEVCRLGELKYLGIANTRVGDPGLEKIKGLVHMLSLWTENSAITDAGLAHLQGMKKLMNLTLQRNQVSDTGLKYLHGLTNLRTLNLEDTKVTGAGIKALQRALPQCKVNQTAAATEQRPEAARVVVDSPGDADRQAAAWLLSFMSHVEVDVAGTRQTLEGPPVPAARFLLGKVDLKGYQWVGDDDLQRLKGTGCTEIELWDTAVTDAGLEHLGELKNLRRLGLTHTKVTGTGFKHLQRIRGFSELWAARCPIDDTSLASVAGLSDLSLLTLESTKVSDAGLKHVRGLVNLRTLTLTNLGVTDIGMEEVRYLPGLTQLALSGTQVGDGALKTISGLTTLRKLYASKTKVTDAGLPHLQGLKDLEVLSLMHTQVSDDGLKNLHGLTNLRTLNLDGTKVTAAGLKALRMALPKCKIN